MPGYRSDRQRELGDVPRMSGRGGAGQISAGSTTGLNHRVAAAKDQQMRSNVPKPSARRQGSGKKTQTGHGGTRTWGQVQGGSWGQMGNWGDSG